MRRWHTKTHLRDRLLAATTADTHAVDNKSLLSLESHAASLIGPAGAIKTDNARQLSEFPAAHTQKETEHIALLFLPKFFDVLRTINRYKRAHLLELQLVN